MIYDANNTMEFIGKQPIGYVTRNENVLDELRDIESAYLKEHNMNISSMLMDAFTLGVTYGKRMERQNKIT